MKNDCKHEEIHVNGSIAECFDCHAPFVTAHDHEGFAEIENHYNGRGRCMDCQLLVGLKQEQ